MITKIFNDTYQDLFFNLFNCSLILENITVYELNKFVKKLEIEDFNYKAYKVNFEKEMIQVVLDY